MVIVETRARGYVSGDKVPLYNDGDEHARGIVVHGRVVCPTCLELIVGAIQRDTETVELLKAKAEGRAYVYPVPLPKVGDRLWELGRTTESWSRS